ncbi:hypothetical protein ACH4E7_39280 [Kitasatospora sp. NPDC018058]|uniref:hypothetical protein n=1 Tax=Kitasatospora sp. NPDC018058 TaxID=3364025 RepID=UPI0037C0F4E9
MSSCDQARADGITAGLLALGLDPQMKDHGNHACIETEVPDSTTAESWGVLLALLETADQFGLVSSASRGLIAWAAVRMDAPATDDAVAVAGQCRQLYGS